MTTPNQITACASATRQGTYTPEVRMYPSEPHPRWGLLPVSYFFKGKTRDRATALATARTHIAAMKGMSPDQCRAYLAEHGRTTR